MGYSFSSSVLWETMPKALLKSRHRAEADWPAVSQILLPALFVDGCHTGQLSVVWDIPSEPGLITDDGEWLGELFCQLPRHARMDGGIF